MQHRTLWTVCLCLLGSGCSNSYEVTSRPTKEIPRQAPAASEEAADEKDEPPAAAANNDPNDPNDPQSGPDGEDPEFREVGEVDEPENYGNDPLTAPLRAFVMIRDRPEQLRMEKGGQRLQDVGGKISQRSRRVHGKDRRRPRNRSPTTGTPATHCITCPRKGKLMQRKVEQ